MDFSLTQEIPSVFRELDMIESVPYVHSPQKTSMNTSAKMKGGITY